MGCLCCIKLNVNLSYIFNYKINIYRMDQCIKCAYPVSPSGHVYIVINKCIAKICTFCESIEQNNGHIFKYEDILFLTGKCSECLHYISSENEPNLNVSVLNKHNVICDREYCRDCFIMSNYKKINNFNYPVVVWYGNAYELTTKHKNVKPDTRILARRKRERRKTIDPDSMCK